MNIHEHVKEPANRYRLRYVWHWVWIGIMLQLCFRVFCLTGLC